MNAWTSDIPTEPGMYWFYGNAYQPVLGDDIELHFLRVRRTGDGSPVYIMEGNFWYPKTKWVKGQFAKIEEPELPKESL